MSKKLLTISQGYATILWLTCQRCWRPCGCSSMVESQPSKLVAWVRFPSPAPYAPVAQVRWIEQLPSKQWVRGSSPFRRAIFLRNQYGGCSSVGRASDCGSECRGFESRLPPHKTSRRKGRSVPLRPFAYDKPATLGCSQVVRHGTLTPAFAGSSPAIPAIRLVSSVGRATAF